MKRVFIVIGIVAMGLIINVIIVAFKFWFAFGGGFLFSSNPPKPQITYAEFPFRLTYECQGEVKVIEDTIVCEFDGYEIHGSAGKYRKWKNYLKSGCDRITLLDFRNINEYDSFGNRILELYFYWGNAEYYMDDEFEHRKRMAQDMQRVSYLYQTKEGEIGGSGYSADEAWKKYKIRLINWECSLPIENKFDILSHLGTSDCRKTQNLRVNRFNESH